MLEGETPSIVPSLRRSLVLPSWYQWCLGIKGWTGVRGGLMSRGKETSSVDSQMIDKMVQFIRIRSPQPQPLQSGEIETSPKHSPLRVPRRLEGSFSSDAMGVHVKEFCISRRRVTHFCLHYTWESI